ncbi:MAG: GNAT family N-acetyltransferase [Myxococcales bacterium]|nr:GNAT family N-acetyltransferase [Myxococcales bacterium]
MAAKKKTTTKKRPLLPTKGKVGLRPLRASDYKAVVEIQRRSFPHIEPWTRSQFLSQLARFPEGQLGVVFGNKLVGTSSTLIIEMEELDTSHTFSEAADGGHIANHDPGGDTLYGIDIAVDPEFRGLRLARRLYDARKELAVERGLRRMLIAGRMPNYHRHQKKLSPEQYLAAVLDKELRDPVITAQIANGFEALKVLPSYLPSDRESGGNAVLMEWRNPDWVPPEGKAGTGIVRVASVQYEMRTVNSFEEFAKQCNFFVDTAGEYACDFVLFPELLTNQLLSLVPADRPGTSARRLSEFTEPYIDAFREMAIKYNVNVVAGTHMNVEQERLYNIAYLFRRDGTVDKQYKLHVTPAEARWWGTSSGSRLNVFDTDCGKIAILICYDTEFPELARIATAKGARILFVPFNTDLRTAYMRVRYCAHARSIENNVFMVMSGACGNLPFVEGADIHYSQSCILTPSDISFDRDGVAAEATENAETMLVHDLDLDVLRRGRREGSVRTWRDRRKDLYRVSYVEDGKTREA